MEKISEKHQGRRQKEGIFRKPKKLINHIAQLRKTSSLLSGGVVCKETKTKFRKGTKIVLAWSGGKDSYLLLHETTKRGFAVKYLFNLIDREKEMSISPPFNQKLIILQARALGIPLKQINVSTNPRLKFRNFLKSLKKQDINTIGMSYIDARGQRGFVVESAKQAGISVFEPLCSRNRKKLIGRVIHQKIKAVIVGVNTQQLKKDWLGKMISKMFLHHLEKIGRVDYCGERGEFQTCVLDAPLFSKRLLVQQYYVLKASTYYYLYITKVRLVDKP